MIFWGASWINVKILSAYISAYDVAFLRLIIAVILMIPLLFMLGLPLKINRSSWVYIIIASIVMVLYSICFYMGTKHGTAGLGGALVTTLIPINTFLILAFIQKKTLQLKQSFALILGAFGVLTMLNIWYFDLNMIFSAQNIYFLLASLLWPTLTLGSAKTQGHPLVVTFYIYLFSSLILLFFIDLHHMQQLFEFDMLFWTNLISISVLSTAFATSIYFIGVDKLGAKQVSSFIFLVPSSALLLSALFLQEHITFNTLLGTICTVIAIYILNNLKIPWLKK